MANLVAAKDHSSKPPRQLKGQIVVVETAYHQPINDQAKVVDNSYSCKIDSTEQPYGPRRVAVGEEWVPLDIGWIAEAGLMLLRNEEGRFTQKIPTEEERGEANAKVLELGFKVGEVITPISPIPPRQSIRSIPFDLKNLYIRSRKGQAKYTITLFPR